MLTAAAAPPAQWQLPPHLLKGGVQAYDVGVRQLRVQPCLPLQLVLGDDVQAVGLVHLECHGLPRVPGQSPGNMVKAGREG